MAGGIIHHSHQCPHRERQATCNVPTTFPTTTNAKPADPFKFSDGRIVTTKADFACENQEVSAAFQAWELSVFPPEPFSIIASLSEDSLSITASEAGKSITFAVLIQKHSGSDPFPAIITYRAVSLPIPTQGQGSHSAGALTTWAAGVDRIIDALEITPSAGIDPERVGVIGCSRNGRATFVAAALVKRIALGLPQAKGKNFHTASQIFGENIWHSPRFNAFSTKANIQAIGQHQLAGRVALRGLLVIENEIDSFGHVSTTSCMKAGWLIYKALGMPDNMGFTGAGPHNHCSVPATKQADLTAFIGKFLLNQNTNTVDIEKGPSGADVGTYIDWTTPTLS
ncbi:carbohydrate esterase family 15 protein [Didymella exigua CBS 183.55]|uniref:(4-O-methyl)-D-glucuronate--lignin esterase n=1 Tax=Didymella exigua CBS 183.55 TaxID=1150837 RepID=A0A6A5S265_9PLEO|nr:carbohydrate esterase family 15 protein [Didymella exigua CBS 183.55]KAF1933700.1 carbohydrate esterase family 15 protein [Didymella exigua CBS 183.55]